MVINQALDMILWRRRLRRGLAERGELLLSRERTIAEREAVTREREARIVELECEIAERASRIFALEGEVSDAASLLLEREASIGDLSFRLGRMATAARETAETSRDDKHLVKMLRANLSDGSHAASAPLGQPALDEYPVAGLDASTAARWLSEWKAQVTAHEHVQGGSQVLIEPYLLRKYLAGRPTNLLIATREGRNWYDKIELSDLPYIQLLGMIGPGAVVLDCGSNQGINTLSYSAVVGPNGHVHAFDPFPINSEIGAFNARLNDRTNITFHRQALAARPGRISVSVAAQNIVEARNGSDIISVEAITLDSLAGLRPTFIKIDIEGAEIDALEGATELLKTRPSIYLELHPPEIARFGRRPEEIFNYVSLDIYTCLLNYPGQPMFVEYSGQFEMTQPCQIFLIPREFPAIRRFF